MLLYDLFLAPGRYLCRKFSRSRKKTRYQARSVNRGPVVPVSIITWLAVAVLVVVVVLFLGTSPVPPPKKPPSEQNQEQVASNAQSGAVSGPVAQAGLTPQNAPTPQAQSNPQAAASAPEAHVGEETVAALSGQLEPPPATEIWLVIVESIPKSARAGAEESLARHKRRGVNLELLDTDAYPLLKGGMWTLALGPFDTKKDAEAAAAEIKPKVRDLMVRRGL
jgi:hypothetical protein